MIVQTIYLNKYKWTARVFYGISHIDILSVVWTLMEHNVSSVVREEIIEHISQMDTNAGYIYSIPEERFSIIIISPTTSAAQFQNTFDHEKGHLAAHIASVFDIDMYSEEYQYLVGEIGQKLFKVAHLFMCDKCRPGLIDFE